MKPTWTDEQAADATIEVLSEDFEVMVMRSWFKLADRVCEAFVAACEAACAGNDLPLKGRVADFTRGGWRVVINGTDAEHEVAGDDKCMGATVPPTHLAAFWHGWLAGLLHPYGGTLAAGRAANEDTFIAAMRERADG